VLDARDPNGCRSPKTEQLILAEGKKVVFVLNKCDLVPPAVVQRWLQYLRRLTPTIAFKSSTNPSSNRKTKRTKNDNPLKVSPNVLHSGGQTLGVSSLLSLLKNYSRISGSKSTKGPLTVGIIGRPNVGKSSIVNSLTRNASAVKVGREAGITRVLQYVQLDKKVKLIDSPGVIMSASGQTAISNVLTNSIKVQSIDDPVSVVESIMEKLDVTELMKIYKIPHYGSVNELLAHVARAQGRLSRGGRPDTNAAARLIIGDWTSGKIKHFSMPPEETTEDTNGLETVLMSEFSKEFNIDELYDGKDQDLTLFSQTAG